jgi:septal ring factor EnvC (AmiA/AmiB activator)
MSLYGNNETLMSQVGAPVRGGETVATVGSSGGNRASGLYFELRYQGKPFDPLGWLDLK